MEIIHVRDPWRRDADVTAPVPPVALGKCITPHTTDRRSLILGTDGLGAGALCVAGLVGLSGRPLRAQTTCDGTFRAGIAEFDTGDTSDAQVTETKFLTNRQWQLRNNLIEIGPGGMLVPKAATEWSLNGALTIWPFRVRPGVESHNGKTLDAEDVVFSLDLHRGEQSVSQSKAPMASITAINAPGPL